VSELGRHSPILLLLIEYPLDIFEPKTIQPICGTPKSSRPKGAQTAVPAENPIGGGGCVRMEVHKRK
jgi:hypothetical protein